MSGSNLFDLSASNKPKKKKSTQVNKPLIFQSSPPSYIKKDEEIKEILEDMATRNALIRTEMQKLIAKAGQDERDLNNYLQNPSNFSSYQWEKRQENRAELEVKILGMSREQIKQQKKKKEAADATKSRKGKTLGSRKNWINMR